MRRLIWKSLWWMSPKQKSNVRKKTKAVLFGQEKAAHDKNSTQSLPKDAADYRHAFAKGARHDFSLYKHSKARLPKAAECLADSGYQGLLELHARARTPIKKPKGGELTDEQKAFNKALASERVVVEHIIRHLKIFRIVSQRYRNRRRRFMLRVNLIAGLYNYAVEH